MSKTCLYEVSSMYSLSNDCTKKNMAARETHCVCSCKHKAGDLTGRSVLNSGAESVQISKAEQYALFEAHHVSYASVLCLMSCSLDHKDEGATVTEGRVYHIQLEQ